MKYHGCDNGVVSARISAKESTRRRNRPRGYSGQEDTRTKGTTSGPVEIGEKKGFLINLINQRAFRKKRDI